MCWIVFLFFIPSYVATFDGSGNDIDMELDESFKFPITINTINSLLKQFTYKSLNVTFQFEILRALEAINHGRLELTIWSHENWKIPELSSSSRFWKYQNLIKLRLNSRLQLEFLPEMIFKNAVYFKEHRTPLLNTILKLDNYGNIALHSLYTLDIPCTKIIPTRSKCIKYELCGIEIMESQYYNNINAICELHYGSLIHDNNQMHLNWASNNIIESNLPCSTELMPRCIITKIRLSKKEVIFLGEKYDELIACFVLSFPTKDSVII
ncbi:Ceramide glucosyltransferase [Dirofilaria immitis]